MGEVVIDSLGFLLNRALWTLVTSLNAAFNKNGIDLSQSQYVVMRVLDIQEGMSQNKLSTMMHKDAAAIKRSIDILEKKGLVIRKAVTGRKNGLYLTDKGKALMPQIKAIADEVMGGTFGRTEEERQACVTFLECIYRFYEEKGNQEE